MKKTVLFLFMLVTSVATWAQDHEHVFNRWGKCYYCDYYSPELCSHSCIEHPFKAETCTEDGHVAYYECKNCGTLFKESYCMNKLSPEEVVIPAMGHVPNDYNVCKNCFEDLDGAAPCPHALLDECGSDRPTCTSEGDFHEYVQCWTCKRYFICENDETLTRIKFSDMVTPSVNEYHQGHLKLREATATCYVDGYDKHRYCDLCGEYYNFYFDWKLNPTQINALTRTAPMHHNYVGENPVCTNCGKTTKYKELTTMRQLLHNTFYIIVAKAGDQYYAMGKPKKTSTDEYIGGGEGYKAIPVKMNADGTISVANLDVAQLFYVSDNYPLPHGNVKRTWSTFAGFCEPSFGHVTRWGGYPIDEEMIFNKNNLVGGNFHEGTGMTISLYDGSDAYPHITYGTSEVIKTPVNPDNGTIMYSWTYMAGASKYYHCAYLGVNGDGTVGFHFEGFATPSLGETEPEYDNYYPAHAYYLTDESIYTGFNTHVAYGRGLLGKEDIKQMARNADGAYTDACIFYGSEHTDKNDYVLRTFDLSDATIAADVTYADLEAVRAMDYVADNAIFILPSNCAITGENIVKDGKSTVITLEDKGDFEIPVDVDIEAEEINYERLIAGTTHWGTLCLPFEVKSNNAIQLYQLKAVDEGSEGIAALTFTAIDKVEAGQPVVFHKKEPTAEGIFVSATEVKLSAGGVGSVNTNVDEWSMRGTFTATTIQSNVAEDGSADDKKRYYIGSDKFWGAKKTANVAPFRAWFEATEASGVKAANYIIVVDDEEETSILNVDAEGNLNECTEIYDLSGNKLSKAIKGQVNIINGKKIYIK